MSTFDVGDVVKIAGAFTVAATGAAVDPGAVSLTVRTPDGVKTTYVYGTDEALVKSVPGSYYLNFTVTQPGRHSYRFASSVSAVAAEEGSFNVRRTETTR